MKMEMSQHSAMILDTYRSVYDRNQKKATLPEQHLEARNQALELELQHLKQRYLDLQGDFEHMLRQLQGPGSNQGATAN